MTTIADATSKLLVISTAHVSKETCEAASAKNIDWAVTHPTPYGFFAYCHEERTVESRNDLWAVLQFAVARDFHYVLFDADADVLDQSEAGLEIFDW